MKNLFKNIKPPQSEEEANILDTILIMLATGRLYHNLYEINLELRRCGFYISYPLIK